MLVVLYLAAFTLLFGLAFALPELVAGARALPPSPQELSPDELERAKRITRDALAGGRLMAAFLCSAACVGAGVWFRALPGLRRPGAG